MNRLPQVLTIDGVDVYIHWSVFVIAGVILLGAFQEPALSLIGLICYFGVLLIHECGHMVAARRKGCAVSRIELYPVYGVTRFDAPWTRYDHQVIAWAGVVAQMLVAVPIVSLFIVLGYTRFEILNEIFAILGFFNVAVAIFNLLPMRPLDGAIAWGLIPTIVKRTISRRSA